MHFYSCRNDSDLLVLIREDDECAFAELYERYWKKLFIVAVNRIGSMENAEEIVQDIFTTLWYKRGSLVITDGLDRYLTVAVKYRVIKALSKETSRRNYIKSLNSGAEVDDSTRELLAFEELQSELAKHICTLPSKCQLVFRLSRENGFSQKQIAAHLNISEKTVEAHLGKAFRILRSKLASFLFLLL